ncbi:MAG: trypsin-like peptidase domain-containing protein [Planctomycetota bacterium]
MRRFMSFGPAAVVLLTVIAALVAAPEVVRRVEHAQAGVQVRLARQELRQDDILERINRATRAIAQSVEPGVVHLMTGGRWGGGAAGSGWVYDDAGHIVTNAHVVGGSDSVSVQLHTGRTLRAEVLGVDVFTDIAVLRADEMLGGVPLLRASGELPQQGDRVFAFGSPFNFKFSMSEGIVSGLGRDPNTGGGSAFTNFIQTDAAVNPGNSGGPLVDVRGRVIGMNVAIATGRSGNGEATADEGQSAGISFAIPLPTIESVVDQLIENGRVARGRLGIAFDPRRSRRPIIDGGEFRGLGVLVGDITQGGPAEKAGLMQNDVIESIGGQAVPSRQLLRAVVNTMRPGEELEVVAWRDGAAIRTLVVLDELDPVNAVGPATANILSREVGLVVNLGDDSVTVLRVAADSPADRAGIEAGQRILEVNGRRIDGISGFIEAVASSRIGLGRATEFVVRGPGEDDEPRSVTVRVRL